MLKKIKAFLKEEKNRVFLYKSSWLLIGIIGLYSLFTISSQLTEVSEELYRIKKEVECVDNYNGKFEELKWSIENLYSIETSLVKILENNKKILAECKDHLGNTNNNTNMDTYFLDMIERSKKNTEHLQHIKDAIFWLNARVGDDLRKGSFLSINELLRKIEFDIAAIRNDANVPYYDSDILKNIKEINEKLKALCYSKGISPY